MRWVQQALDGIWTDLLRRTLVSQGIVTTSRHAQTTGGGLWPPVGIALRAAAVVTYLIQMITERSCALCSGCLWEGRKWTEL